MRPLDILGFSFGAVSGRKLRFVLTLLGVMIGVAAIVALLSLSQGLQVSVTDQLRSGLATDTLIVAPMDPESGALRISDDDRMKDIDGVTMVAPVIQGIGVMEAGDATLEVEVVGVDLQKYRSIYGAMFTSEEGEIPRGSADGEMVIGSAVKDPEQDGSSIARPGDTVALMGSDLAGPMATDRSEFRIAATLREVGGMNIGGLSDSAVYISLDDAVDLFGTSDCTFIIVQMEDDDEATIDAVTAAIKDAFDDQVRISSSRGVQDLVDRVFSTLDLFLISVASISLMVAGAGIMNTMM
ncbi:MAG TPA: ABC transporter permease, partial [Methanomassiliicoccaceae archaeon]|nr:ABC transporter permease [Methanomassiliicoccaceae archaeon]